MSLTLYKRGTLRQILGLNLGVGPSFTIAQEPFQAEYARPKVGDLITDSAGAEWVVSSVGEFDAEAKTWAVTCTEAP